MKLGNQKWLTYIICLWLVGFFTIPARSEMLPSELSGSSRESDIAQIKRALEIKQVKQKLSDHGMSVDEVQQKLDRLDDEQIHTLAQQSSLAVGADRGGDGGGGFFGFLITLLIIVLLVILILKLMDKDITVKDRTS